MTPEERTVLVPVLRRILAGFVAEDYTAVERMTCGIRLSSGQIRDAIEDYGGTVVAPPAEALDELDVIEVQGSSPRRWSVRFDLWTEEEGKSDLTMELTVEQGTPVKIELDNLHVL